MTSKLPENFAEIQGSLQKLTEIALSEAKKKGADEAKVATSVDFQKRLVVENKEFSLANSHQTQRVSLLVHKDQKKGSCTTNVQSADAIKKTVDDALALAAFSVADPALNMPDVKQAPKAKPLEFMYNSDLAHLELAELQESMAMVLNRLIRDKRVALDRFEMAVNTSQHNLANSWGVTQSEIQSQVSWSFFGMAVDGKEVSGFDYDGGFAFDKESYLQKALQQSEEFAHKLIGQLNPKRCSTYKGLVLLTPRAVEEILLPFLRFHASGHQVMDGKSRWEKSIGKQVVSPMISIKDDPHGAGFAGATSFDADGLPTSRLQIIDGGVLKTHLHNCYSAKRTGSQSTASSGGPFALRLKAGTTKLNDLFKSRKELLMVDRFSGNLDPIKGDFSGVAKNSRVIIDGRDETSVTETMIAGNFFDIIAAPFVLSDNLVNVSGHFESPYMLVDHVSVTGG